MIKSEWKLLYGAQRKAAREAGTNALASLTVRALTMLFREIYGTEYLPSQRAFMGLVRRYEDKMTRASLLPKKKLIRSWRPSARQRAKDRMHSLVYSKNPFLSLTIKDDSYSGKYISVPITYGT